MAAAGDPLKLMASLCCSTYMLDDITASMHDRTQAGDGRRISQIHRRMTSSVTTRTKGAWRARCAPVAELVPGFNIEASLLASDSAAAAIADDARLARLRVRWQHPQVIRRLRDGLAGACSEDIAIMASCQVGRYTS